MEKPYIGIPVSNDLESFREMIDSLLCSTTWFEKIIIIESESKDGCKEYCDSLKARHDKIEVIHTKKEGPLKAYNLLFQIARENNKDLFITQSDVLFPELYKRDWLEGMSQAASHPEVGLVIPINGGGISGPDYLDGLAWVGGWTTYISKKCWEIFKEYNEDYPMGYGVDIEMTYLINKKYKTKVVNYWADHHQMNAREHDNNPNAEKARKEAGRFFKKKYGI